MVLFFDGFDLGNNNDAGLLLNARDFTFYWGVPGTISQASFVDGNGTARGLSPNFQGGDGYKYISYAQTYPEIEASQQVRFGFFVKYEPIDNGVTPNVPTPAVTFRLVSGGLLYHFEIILSSETNRLQFRLSSVAANSNSLNDERTVLAEGLPFFDPVMPTQEFIPVEFFINKATGRIEVRWDGSLVMQADVLPTTTSGFIEVWLQTLHSIPSGGAAFGHYDDFWLTDGTNPTGHAPGTIHAVSVAASVNYQLGTFRGFINAPSRIEGPEHSPGSTGSDMPQFFRYHYWFFPSHPDGPWNAERFNNLATFGVCYTPSSGGSTGSVVAMGLGVLRNNGAGYPVVHYFRPSGSVAFSNVWQKTDPTLSYTAHVNKQPRLAFANGQSVGGTETWLFTNTPGCIQFGYGDVVFDKVGLAFAQEFDIEHHDWRTVTGGEDFLSYFITGYKIAGEGDKSQQSNYATINYEPEPNASAFFQGVWDYANNPTTGRWSTRQQVVWINDSRYDHLMRKLKVRGQGRVLQFRVTSERGKPFRINGWTVLTTVEQTV